MVKKTQEKQNKRYNSKGDRRRKIKVNGNTIVMMFVEVTDLVNGTFQFLWLDFVPAVHPREPDLGHSASQVVGSTSAKFKILKKTSESLWRVET